MFSLATITKLWPITSVPSVEVLAIVILCIGDVGALENRHPIRSGKIPWMKNSFTFGTFWLQKILSGKILSINKLFSVQTTKSMYFKFVQRS